MYKKQPKRICFCELLFCKTYQRCLKNNGHINVKNLCFLHRFKHFKNQSTFCKCSISIIRLLHSLKKKHGTVLLSQSSQIQFPKKSRQILYYFYALKIDNFFQKQINNFLENRQCKSCSLAPSLPPPNLNIEKTEHVVSEGLSIIFC